MSLIAKRKDSRTIAILTACFLIVALFGTLNGENALLIFSFQSLPIMKRVMLSLLTYFDIKDSFTVSTFLLAVIGSILS